MKTNIISIVNQKGGVGKTTTAVNLTTALAAMGFKTLLVDLDPQGNCSSGFGIDQSARKVTIYQCLIGQAVLQDAVMPSFIPGLDIITANTNLAAAEFELISLKKREFILKDLLVMCDCYDYIIIDCPPSLNLLTINALVASNQVLIPMQCEFYSLEGLSHLLKTIEIIAKKLNPIIKIGVVFTMYDRRNKLTEQVEQDVRGCLGDLVYKSTIPRNVRLSEAPSHGKPAIIYDHKCSGSIAYMELTREILEKHKEVVYED
jgi:chromosome partitioning protein